MAIPTLQAIGFCAHYSTPGDWAFDYALGLCRRHALRLNVFHFLSDTYDPTDKIAEKLSPKERAKLAIEREKELRLYYDRRAMDYLEVGFRLCEDNEWTELHRCLVVREFQVLVLGYIEPPVTFAGKPLEEFANSFVCPVVLVGPESAQQYHLNSQAAMIHTELGLPEGCWSKIESVSA